MSKFGSFIRRNKPDIAVIIIVIAQAGILYINTATLQQLQSNSRIRTQQIATLSRHVDCVASLFTQSQRPVPRIIDLKQCNKAPTQ